MLYPGENNISELVIKKFAVFTLSIQPDIPWANSVDPDQMQQNVASDQGLHCLPISQQFLYTSTGSKMNLLTLCMMGNFVCFFVLCGFLAHLSKAQDELLGWAIVITLCPSSVVNNWFVNTLEVTVFSQSWWNLLRMFTPIKSRSGLKLSHLGLKTRSPGQSKGKYC